MKHKHIEKYIGLRQALTNEEWSALNGLYTNLLYEKERQLTKDISLDDSDIKVFRRSAQTLLETNENTISKALSIVENATIRDTSLSD